MQDADKATVELHRGLRSNPCSYFESVKANLAEEMKRANVELRKRGTATIDQNHLPGFNDQAFLTFGTDSLCRVGLGISGGQCRITAVICGPPNGYELSRKEYPCCQDATCKEELHAAEAKWPVVAASPCEVAVDIISSILAGKFD
jgi:hypothetical protein